MGRNKLRTSNPLAGFIKLVLGVTFLGGLIFGVSYSVSRLSEVTLADLYNGYGPLSEVAGSYIEKIDSPIVDKIVDSANLDSQEDEPEAKVVFKIALLSDSHNDNDNLAKALDVVKEEGVEEVIFLGDYTAFGPISELTAAKKVMDNSGLTYYSIPGDHDLGSTGDATNFTKVFDKRYQKLRLNGVTLILLDNSDNEKGVDNAQLEWFTKELLALKKDEVNFVIMANPLYNTNGLNKLMGENDEAVSKQAVLLLSLVREAPVKAIFSGDNHLSGEYKDPVKEGLMHIGVGALTDIPEARNLQSPRFDYLTVYEDGTFKTKEEVL